MEVNQLFPLLNQAQDVLVQITNTNDGLQTAQQNLLRYADGLVKRDTTITGSSLLSETTNLLNALMSSSQGQSTQYDDVLHSLKIAASELIVEAGSPNLEDAFTQLNSTRVNTLELRETILILDDDIKVHDTLGARMAPLHPTPDELSRISQHRQQFDKLQLLTSYFQNTLDKMTNQLYSLLELLEATNDPTIKCQLLNDNIPIALLPVRVETRFMTIKHVRNNKAYQNNNQAIRSDSDVSTAGNIDRNLDLQYGPFSTPVRDLQPAPMPEMVPDKRELWIRIYPDDIAINAHEDQLTQDEIDAGKTYWDLVWHAGIPNVTDEQGAWRVLAGSFGARRAAWIAKKTKPTNSTLRPTAATPLNTTLSPLPTYPSLTPKPLSWTTQAHSDVMPDRFVVRLYSTSGMREVTGLPIPNPLPVGFDPNNPNYLNQNNGVISMPPEIRWLTDFDAAEQIGMGIRVPLQGDEDVTGFSRILVLGLRINTNAMDGAQELEKLFDNHHYKTGLALVPQGTPTNNTDKLPSGYQSYEPTYDQSFAIEQQNPLFTTSTLHYDKPDGQRLAEAFGVSPTVFEHVQYSNGYDMKEGMAMSRALWPATLGYYMKNMLTPAITPNDVTNTRSFFTNYVLGRGLVPAFRVGKQPYGVLPTTVYSRWAYSNPYSYEAKLNSKILQPLNAYWENNLVSQVEQIITQVSDPDKKLARILGLHPASIEFYQRITSGSYTLSNLILFANLAGIPIPSIFNSAWASSLSMVYNSFGFNFNNMPRIFTMAFMDKHHRLNGPVIDTLKLSETRPLENVHGGGTTNYIDWLRNSRMRYIRSEDFTNINVAMGTPPPQALLYLLLRQAWMLEYIDTSQCILKDARLISQDAGMNYEMINLAMNGNRAEITDEHRDMLYGKVRSEIMYEHDLVIEDTMRNLSTNQDYLHSGMTPQQYEQHLRDQFAPQIDPLTQDRYSVRLEGYNVQQAQLDYLTQAFPQVTGVQSMEDYLHETVSNQYCFTQLGEVGSALDLLKNLPTARLERCFVESLDTCAYRLDAWMTGMVSKRLIEQRAATPGVYIGAYSIVENLKPGGCQGISVVNLDGDTDRNTWEDTVTRLAARKEWSVTAPGDFLNYPGSAYLTPIGAQYQPATFIYLGEDRSTHLIEDRHTGKIMPVPCEDTEGFILAPSLTHAITAAIMRAGYTAHQKDPNATPDRMAVNLSSARVRKAMFYLDGVRNGQQLGALLGYQFERGLHDHLAPLYPGPTDGYLDAFREKYPLVSGSVVNTPTGQNGDAQMRYVVDGLKLIEAYRAGTWSSGVTIGSSHLPIITAEIDGIIDAMDAIGDLLLSEAVYQLAYGNYERAAAVLNAMGYGNKIPEPEIVKTPRQGNVITNRCAVQLTPAVATASAWSGTSYRALTEPALNNWLSGQLPAPTNIVVRVLNTSTSAVTFVNMNTLGLQPLDLIALFTTPGSDQLGDSSELSRRIIYSLSVSGSSDTLPLQIDYRNNTGFSAGMYTIFELQPLIRSLINILNHCRALTPDDFILPGQASSIIPNPLPANMGLLNGQIITRLDARVKVPAQAPNGLTATANAIDAAINAFTNNGITATTMGNLRTAMMNAARYGIEGAIPETAVTVSADAKAALVLQAQRVSAELSQRVTSIGASYTAAVALTDRAAQYKALNDVARTVFGRWFKVFPDFGVYNSSTISTSLTYPGLLSTAGTYAVDEWMHGVSRVRPRVGEYCKEMMLAESMFKTSFTTQRVVQMPVVDTTNFTDRWIAMQLPQGYEIPSDVVSIVIESDTTTATVPTCGMVIDEWTEKIPLPNITTGIAMHYDQPSNEAPQSVLLAVTPQVDGSWQWNDLMDMLNETILMAAKRAVEPDHIQTSDLSQVLPAIMAAMTGGTDTSPSLDLSRNIINSQPGMNNPVALLANPQAPLNLNDLSIGNSNAN